ncbi:MAG: SprT-like domain-containing protein [Candidatus Hydrogenedens sp.]
MKYSQQLEFCFEDAVINTTRDKPIAKPAITIDESPKDVKKIEIFVNNLQKDPCIKEVSIKSIGKKIEINIKYHYGKDKTYWAYPSLLDANNEEFEIIRKIFTHQNISPAISMPLIKKHLIFRPCHWKLNWTPEGKHYNLENYFNELNRKYFMGKLKNKIYWSKRKFLSNRIRKQYRFCLGFFCKGCLQIFISPLLDTDKIPNIILEVIVYHEMVHAYLFNDFPHSDKSHGKKFKQLYSLHPHVIEVEKILKTPGIYKILRKEATQKSL